MRKVGWKNLEYKAIVEVERVLDALEWCENYNGLGFFAMSWAITHTLEDADLCGIFTFSDKQDHTLFSMTWCGK